MASPSPGAARLVSAGAALLNLSVLADSAVEHYRGSFRDPFMVLPLAASAAGLVGDTREASARGARAPGAGWRNVLAVAVGVAGLGFHAFNVGKRVGGFRAGNLYYGAPLGAPGALVLSGLLGALGRRLHAGGSAQATAGLAAAGLMGTVAEAGLLHHRGAFQNPAMWLPVTLPPLAAAALLSDALQDRPHASTRGLLGATALLGLAGSAFHAFGVHRHMGGWRNWRQTLLEGPPLPAPPAFTGLAVAALGALSLLGRTHD